jgi:hypothetical protein
VRDVGRVEAPTVDSENSHGIRLWLNSSRLSTPGFLPALPAREFDRHRESNQDAAANHARPSASSGPARHALP